jgi:glutaredoxin
MPRVSAPSSSDVELVLYTRRDCHLCEAMKREIARADSALLGELREIDVDSDPALAARHGDSVPVLAIDGRVAFKVRLTAGDFLRKLERARREKKGRV